MYFDNKVIINEILPLNPMMKKKFHPQNGIFRRVIFVKKIINKLIYWHNQATIEYKIIIISWRAICLKMFFWNILKITIVGETKLEFPIIAHPYGGMLGVLVRYYF